MTTKREKTIKRKPKQLRFAVMIRVSTEKQEKHGESLSTQHQQITDAVAAIGGKIVKRYAGQEHATEGWEREQLQMLLDDAGENVFDAVMVTDASRWSRDNVKSETQLNYLKENGIRFFTLTQEHDLWQPDARLFLAMSSVINGYQAAVTAKKSLENRIARAKEGSPTSGQKPYARIWNKKTKEWSVDAKKKKVIQDVAKRYIAGESLPELAKEIGMTHSRLHRILTQRCGPIWVQSFNSDRNNIHEEIETKVPELLSAETILAVKDQFAANKTWNHQPAKKYLLSRMIFCAHCGSALSGQDPDSGVLYYRHWGKKPNCLGGYIPADAIENEVIWLLLEMFGNPAGVQRAIEKATPNLEKIERFLSRRERIIKELETIKQGRKRVIQHIAKDNISDEEADVSLDEYKSRQIKLTATLEQVDAQLENQPSPDSIKATAELVAKKFAKLKKYTNPKVVAAKSQRGESLDKISWDDKRELVKQVFGGLAKDGKRLGVYLSKVPKKKRVWTFEIEGTLCNGIAPHGVLNGIVSKSQTSPRT